MICKSCGVHFCYVCGQAWDKHKAQPGGISFYRCSLGPQATRADASAAATTSIFDQAKQLLGIQTPIQTCRVGYHANVRDAAWERGLAALARRLLGDVGGHSEELTAYLSSGVEVALESRRALSCSYVLKYYIPEEQWRAALKTRVPELEVNTNKLEECLGLGALGRAAHAAGFSAAALLEDPATALGAMDLREGFAYLVAAAEHSRGALARLSLAVRLQKSMMLDAASAVDQGAAAPAPPPADAVPEASRASASGLGMGGLMEAARRRFGGGRLNTVVV